MKVHESTIPDLLPQELPRKVAELRTTYENFRADNFDKLHEILGKKHDSEEKAEQDAIGKLNMATAEESLVKGDASPRAIE